MIPSNGASAWSTAGDESLNAVKPDDRGIQVSFHTEQRYNKFQSAKQNRPIFEPRILLTKIINGDTSQVVVRPIRMTEMEDDRINYPVQWQRFQQNQEQRAAGTPIENLPGLKPEQIAELKYLRVETVDALAALDDGKGQKIMGFVELRKRAQAFLDFARDASTVANVTLALEERDRKINELMAMVEKLTEAQGSAQPVKRGRGRPRKEQA